MNLVAALRTKAAGGTPYGGGYAGFAAPYVDAFNRSRAPLPLELIRENLGTAYACATLNADLIASTPLRLYVKTRKGESKSRLSKRGDTRPISSKTFKRLDCVATKAVADAVDVEEVTTHPMLDLLAKPNRLSEDGVGMSGFNLFNLTQQYQEVVGRCYWWIDKSGIGNTPRALWVLAPQRVAEMPSYGKGDKIIDYYQFAGGANTERYETDEIAPFRMPDLYNVYTGGMSPLRAAFEQVRLARKVDAQTNATLDNGGKPSAIWSPAAQGDVGGFIDKVEAERMRRAVKQAFAQAGAGGVMVAETAGSLSILNWPMKDIIDASRMELTTDVVCATFNVPTTKFKRSDSNRASAQTGDYAHAKDAGLPRCRRNEAALNTFLIPAYGPEAAERLFFAYDDPPGLHDDESERDQWAKSADRGDVTRNESRSRIGLEDVPWGNQPVLPNTMVAVDASGKPIIGTPLAGALTNLEKTITKSMRGIAKRLRKLERRKTAPSPLPKGDAIKAIMHRVFGEQRRAILNQIDEHHSKTKAEDGKPPKPALPAKFIPLDAWTEQISRESKPVIEVIMRQEGGKLLERVGASPDVYAVFDKNIPEAAQNLTLKFAESTNETTSMELSEALEKLRGEIEQNLIEGDPRKLLTDKVNEIFDKADTERAETIAKTEATRASGDATLQSAKDSNVVSGKYWMASADACEICDGFAAMGTIPLDQSFGEDDYGPIDHEPGHPRCQCTCGFDTEDGSVEPHLAGVE